MIASLRPRTRSASAMATNALETLERPLLTDRERREVGIAQAAWMVEDIILEKDCAESYPEDLRARKLHLDVCVATNEYNWALGAMVLLTIFETPPWCDNKTGFSDFSMKRHDRCQIPGVSPKEVFLSNVNYLPPACGMIIELVTLFIILRKSLQERKLQSNYFEPRGATYHNKKVVDLNICMVFCNLVDLVAFYHYRQSFRLMFIPRTIFLLLLPAVRRLGGYVCSRAVIGRLNIIAVIYVGVLVFFAWICRTVFSDMGDVRVNGEPVDKGFETFLDTFYTMFVAGSTEEFVECFLPTYTKYRASGVLWLVFLIVVNLLMLNLVLDTLVAAYKTFSEEAEEDTIREKVNGIKKVYAVLSGATGEKNITHETYCEFIKEFSRSPSVKPINQMTANIVFTALGDSTGTMSQHEFFDVCSVIECDFWVTKKDSPVKETFPALWQTDPYQFLIKSMHAKGDQVSAFDKFMTGILCINFILVIIESVYDSYDWTETPMMTNLEIIFSLVYVMEVGLKLCVWSWSQYSSSRLNVFDFGTTWLLLATSIADEMSAEGDSSSNVKRYVNILRLFRLLRVIKQLRRFKSVQVMVNSISTIISSSTNIILTLSVVVYGFTLMSVQLWGGLLYKSNPKLEESEYLEKKLYALNFNDFGVSLGVWVYILLCEYVPIFPDAIAKTSAIPCIWLVFLVFYVVAGSVIFELVKALSIEMFVQIYEREQELKKERKARKKLEKNRRNVKGIYRYEPTVPHPLAIRTAPAFDAPRTQHKLKMGDVVMVSDEKPGNDGVLFLELADGRGWVFDMKPGVGAMCVKLPDDTAASFELFGEESEGTDALKRATQLFEQSGEQLWYRERQNQFTQAKINEAIEKTRQELRAEEEAKKEV